MPLAQRRDLSEVPRIPMRHHEPESHRPTLPTRYDIAAVVMKLCSYSTGSSLQKLV